MRSIGLTQSFYQFRDIVVLKQPNTCNPCRACLDAGASVFRRHSAQRQYRHPERLPGFHLLICWRTTTCCSLQ